MLLAASPYTPRTAPSLLVVLLVEGRRITNRPGRSIHPMSPIPRRRIQPSWQRHRQRVCGRLTASDIGLHFVSFPWWFVRRWRRSGRGCREDGLDEASGPPRRLGFSFLELSSAPEEQADEEEGEYDDEHDAGDPQRCESAVGLGSALAWCDSRHSDFICQSFQCCEVCGMAVVVSLCWAKVELKTDPALEQRPGRGRQGIIRESSRRELGSAPPGACSPRSPRGNHASDEARHGWR